MATAEITEEECLSRYGPLQWEALVAFATDPTYLCEMAEAANLILYKRELWEARAEALAKAETPDQVKSLTDRLLRERGIQVPRRRAA